MNGPPIATTWRISLAAGLLLAVTMTAGAAEPKRLLLLGQGPDGHPPTTHEYMAGVRIMAATLARFPEIETTVVKADEPWRDGPELIDTADGVVIFLSQGAKWIHDDPKRLAALKRLAARGGGFVGLHWGIGCKDAKYIENYVSLVGGCHGGPDRKYKVVLTEVEVAVPRHPVTTAISNFRVREEFYYRLKFAKPPGSVTPLLRVRIDGEPHAVAWAWERPDGGRSAGFSGGHFHRNWELTEYRRLMAQAVLWSLHLPIPTEGVDPSLAPGLLSLESKSDAQ